MRPDQPLRPVPKPPDRPVSPPITGEDDPLSAMTPRFNLFFRWFARRFFGQLSLDGATVEHLREIENRGTVIYVMRYASRLDYFLFNALFLRDSLRISAFANGIRFYYYRPLDEILRTALGPRRAARGTNHEVNRAYARDLAREGKSFFLFLRTERSSPSWRRRRGAVPPGRSELDLLEDVVGAVWNTDRSVHLVPLALFWRKGPRARRRFLNLFYGAQTRPSDLAKVTSFLTTYRDLAVKAGEPIDLHSFIQERRDQGPVQVARMVRRSILMFLYREEKVVEGPTLRPRQKVLGDVLGDAGVNNAISARAADRRVPVERARADAESMFHEIAANMNSTFLAGLNVIASAIVRRLFGSIDVAGLDRVASYAKRHPLVLLPNHRSYFDFIIVSTLFYANYLIPPHIAARENMGFGPFGFLFRRAGAFFMRSSFDDPLYKEVFRSYVAHLVREGFTQEFFIEGGRSRTGKTLAPRLGMLNWTVEAFLTSERRDLFFVPIAISYERIVEEGAMVNELEGGKKTGETVLGLVRARRFLRRRFGSVFLNFGEPISLAETLGPRRRRFAAAASPEVHEEKRAFVTDLANRIAERINWATVPNSTSIAASALLGERQRGMLRPGLVSRMQEIVDLLRLQDVRLTPALEREEGDFEEAIASLLSSDLLRLSPDPRGEILYYEESARRALDLYRNSIIHFLVAPSFLSRRVLSGPSLEELRRDLAEWLDFFYLEFFTPRGEVLAAHFNAFVDHFERFGWVEHSEGRVHATEKGVPYFRFLAEQTRGLLEAYYAAVGAALSLEGEVTVKELRKAVAQQFERDQLLGEVDHPEAANPVTFANALDLLVRHGILAAGPTPVKSARSRDPAYVRGPAYDDLPALRERLATALSAR